MSKKEKILCGLDIGTTKVCLIVARAAGERGVEIVSTGYAHSQGLKKGIVVQRLCKLCGHVWKCLLIALNV